MLLAAGVPSDSNLHHHCCAINSDLCNRHVAAFQLSISACKTINLSVVLPMEAPVDAGTSRVASLQTLVVTDVFNAEEEEEEEA